MAIRICMAKSPGKSLVKMLVKSLGGNCCRLAIQRRYSSQLSYEGLIHNSRENVASLLEKHDRSSYILSQYIPEPTRDAYMAIRAFSLEINKINDGGSSTASQATNHLTSTMGVSTADMKFKFWSDLLSKIFMDPNSDKHIGEPIAILLRDAIRNDLNLDIGHFHQFLQTRRHFLQTRQFKSLEQVCSYGEGTYSQLNYLTQGLLLSPSISPSTIQLLEYSSLLQSKISDIAAHIGQATAVSSMILGLKYYCTQRNQVTLPTDLMTKHDVSQETVLRAFQGHLKPSKELEQCKGKLKGVIYDTAVMANDHILASRDKLAKAQDEIKQVAQAHQNNALIKKHQRKWRKGIPDVIFTPFMVAIPTTLYLQKLEKYDFNVFNPRLEQKEWRLAWRSFKNYYSREI